MALRITDSRDFAAGMLYIVFGAAVAVASLGLTIGTPRNMGAGFFPFVVALALVAAGVVVGAGAIHRTATETELGRWNLRPMILVSLAVVTFGLLLRPAGLVVAVPALVAICALATGSFTLRKYALTVAVLLPMCWAIFVAMLGLPVPLVPPALAGG